MRTFSEDDARAVFARAAREQQSVDEARAPGEGLTLDELQEIGRASRRLDARFDAALDRTELLARTKAPPARLGAETRSHEAPDLGDAAAAHLVDPLGDASGDAPARSSGTRARSR